MGTREDQAKLSVEQKKEKELNTAKYLDLTLSATEQDKLVKKVLYDVEQDEKSRKEYLDKVVEVLDLYEGKVEKEALFEGGATVSTRIVTMTVEILHAILYPMIWNEDLHYWTPVEKSDIQSSEAVNQFMKWDARYSKLARFVDDYVKFACLEGTIVSKNRWCEDWKWVQKRVPRQSSIIKKIKKLVRNVSTGKGEEVEVEEGDFDVEYVPRKMEYAVSELIPLEDVGFPPYSVPGVDEEALDHIWHRTHPYIYEIEDKEARGYIKPGVSALISKALEEPTIKKLKSSGTIKERMDAEGSQAVELCKESTPLEQIEWYGKYKVGGKWEEVVCWVEATTEKFLAATLLRKLNKFEKRPFKITQLIRRMDRMYGISIAELVKEYQKILDEMQNQTLNAGKLATQPPGFYRAASGFDPEQVIMQPGIMIPVDDINDVRWATIPANTLPSHQEMRLIIELVERIASIGSFQSGQESNIVRSRSTARGTLAIIAQGERRFNVLGKRLQYQLADIMKGRLQLYQQFIPPGFANRILGEGGQQVFPEGLEPEDIMGEFDLYMTLDATGGSKSQKLEIAQGLYEAYLPNPIVQEDPSRMWEISALPLKELGIVNVEQYLGERPKSLEEMASDQGMTVEQFKQALMQEQMAAAQQQQAAAGPQAGSSSGASNPATPTPA